MIRAAELLRRPVTLPRLGDENRDDATTRPAPIVSPQDALRAANREKRMSRRRVVAVLVAGGTDVDGSDRDAPALVADTAAEESR